MYKNAMSAGSHCISHFGIGAIQIARIQDCLPEWRYSVSCCQRSPGNGPHFLPDEIIRGFPD